ncbi:NtaA/DmoA family FMN-dependent monooxygenase [uncultured Amnibacterium sp.]|uniref:NtaA/DmoA family FMN-dependent monooxygenase n=1 Tax=uncultured Amnibacterium sp. TaxID=1631851 RepID=UPI0035C9758C
MTVHFGWFLGAGFGVQGWGDPSYGVGYDWTQPRIYQDAARAFEAAAFDLLVIEDGVAVPDTYRGTAEVNLAAARFVPKHDPLPLVPYLLGATERLGIVPTLSASFWEPYTAARLLATLQHFAHGRLGFNVVTSGSDLAAQNYGLDKQIEHDLRYDRADEWLDVVRKLWRSWEPGAVVEDTANGVYADFGKVHTIDHQGRFFRVRGPLNTLPPEEEPVMVQAGASGRGQAFAGRHSDVVLALASTPERMQAHRDGVRQAAADAGRDPDAITVLFVVNPIPTVNAEHTASVRAARAELTQAAIDEQLQSISYLTNVDFATFDLDEPLPSFETNSNRGTLDNFVRSAPEGSTLREVLAARAKADGLAIVGTPVQIADRLGELAEGSGADGFLFTGQVHPAHVHRTLDPLVPVLHDAGLLQRELPATTLRGNLAAR